MAATVTDMSRVVMTWRAAYLPYRVKASRRGWLGLSTGASVVLVQLVSKVFVGCEKTREQRFTHPLKG
jgi:hypothetical protein